MRRLKSRDESGTRRVRSCPGTKSLSLVALVMVLDCPGPLVAGEHPALVSAAETDCVTCHEDLLDRSSVHAPAAEDCETCHELSISDTETRATLVDSEPGLCLVCHDDLAAAASGELEHSHYPVTESCLTCHDPHGADEPGLLIDAPAALCATCHDLVGLGSSHGGQITGATDCTQCHDPHGSNHDKMLARSRLHPPFADGSCDGCHRPPAGKRVRLRARGSRLCRACHGDVPSPGDDDGHVHAALRDERGKAGCLACHDPHMSDQAALVHVPGNALCGTCHADVVAAAGSEKGHAPAAEDCLGCHGPHDSSESHLLLAPVGELCRTCHDPDDAELAAAHLGADPASLECAGCHTPHGGVQAHLLRDNLHAPVEDGCDNCHEGAADRLVEDGESSLCVICHDDVGETAEQAPVPHAALEVGRCADCHDPHASAQKSLIKLPGDGVCVVCHEEKSAASDEVAHGVIDAIGCQACHEPHGGDRANLLRTEQHELCLSCHDPTRIDMETGSPTVLLLGRFEVPVERVRSAARLRLSADGSRGHPVDNHPTVWIPGKKGFEMNTVLTHEMDCLTCHDAHKGRSRQLLRWGAKSSMEACAWCHPK